MSITPKYLMQSLQFSHYILLKQAQGVTHAESVRQPPYPVNCFNWLLGHIILHRDIMLGLLDEAPVLTPEEVKLYEPGSPPIHEGDEAVPFERLTDLLTMTQERLMAKLGQITADDFADLLAADGDPIIGSGLIGLAWHETYHVGQTEYTRQIAGKNDRIL
jgi:hypothetical protein